MTTFDFTPDFAAGLMVMAHEGQPEKSGGDYHQHPARCAAMVPYVYKALVFLHDTVEDTALTIERLRQLGAPETLLRSLDIMSKPPKADRPAGFTYVGWIEYIIGTRDIAALLGKHVDVRDHLRPGCEDVMSASKIAEYQAADELLRCTIRDRRKELAADLISRTAYDGVDFESGARSLLTGDRQRIDDLTSRALTFRPRDRQALVAAREHLLGR